MHFWFESFLARLVYLKNGPSERRIFVCEVGHIRHFFYQKYSDYFRKVTLPLGHERLKRIIFEKVSLGNILAKSHFY
jgi:hypothetical protein